MNPASNRDTVLARYVQGPEILARALTGLDDAALDAAPARGGWTIRQIAHHIVDGDDLWKVGIKAALGGEQAEFDLAWYWAQPQDVWADRWAYAKRALDISLDLLRANRAHVLQLVEREPEAWQRSFVLRKPDGETVRLSVGALIEMQADHLVHHVSRIAAIRAERGGD